MTGGAITQVLQDVLSRDGGFQTFSYVALGVILYLAAEHGLSADAAMWGAVALALSESAEAVARAVGAARSPTGEASAHVLTNRDETASRVPLTLGEPKGEPSLEEALKALLEDHRAKG